MTQDAEKTNKEAKAEAATDKEVKNKIATSSNADRETPIEEKTLSRKAIELTALNKQDLTEDNFTDYKDGNIKTLNPVVTEEDRKMAVYGQALSNIRLSKEDGQYQYPGNWQWKRINGKNEIILESLGEHTYTAIGILGSKTDYEPDRHPDYNDPEVEITLDVQPRDLSSLLSIGNVWVNPKDSYIEYTGKPQEPELIVRAKPYKEYTLEKDKDYEIIGFKNNTDAGTARVGIRGIGNYTGEVTSTFEIYPTSPIKLLKDKPQFSEFNDYIFKWKVPFGTSIADIESQLGEGWSTSYQNSLFEYEPGYDFSEYAIENEQPYYYNFAYESPENINYEDRKGEFQVVITEPRSLGDDNADITVKVEPNQDKPTEPKIVITDKLWGKETVLPESTYEVTYENNTQAGTRTAVITGKGLYEGTRKQTFTIGSDVTVEKSDCKLKVTVNSLKDGKINLMARDPASALTVSRLGNGAITVDDGDESVFTAKNAADGISLTPNHPGRANLTIRVAETADYKGATITYPVVVSPIPISRTQIKVEDGKWTYNGSALTPACTVTDPKINTGNPLSLGKDYKVEYSNNINAGQGKITVSGLGDYNGSTDVYFTIHKAVNPAEPVNTQYNAVYGQKLSEIALEGGWAWEKPENLVGNAGEQEHTIFLAETPNYLKKTVNVKVFVDRKPLTDDMVTIDGTGLVYNGSEQEPILQVNDSLAKITTDDYDCIYENNLHAGEASVTVRAKGNYTGEVKKTFVIEKAQPTLEIGSGLAVEKMVSDTSFSLEAVLSNKEGLDYSSSNSEIASVDEKGTVTLHAAGNAKIIVSYKGSQDYYPVQAEVELTVKEKQTNQDNGNQNSGNGNNGNQSSGGGNSSSGSGRRNRSEIVYNSVPNGYVGETIIIENAKVPVYVETGSWSQNADGSWRLTDKKANPVINRWIAAYNPYADLGSGQLAFDWFRFDAEGRMLTGWYQDMDGETYYLNPYSDRTKGKMMTGWNLIDGIWYYFETASTGKRGTLLRNTITPDGYQVDENGAWVQ